MIHVLCPTRDRPDKLLRLHGSMLDTSKHATLIAYVDSDQTDLYPILAGNRLIMDSGPRVGLVGALNTLAHRHRGARIYGMVSDDSVFTAPGWDEYLIECFNGFRNDIGVVSPHHNFGNHCEMPFVSRNWIEAAGWFAWPQMEHYCWPYLTCLMGEATEIVYAEQNDFHLDHQHEGGPKLMTFESDAVGFFNHFALHCREPFQRLKAARG